MRIESALTRRPKVGEEVCGDDALILEDERQVTVAVVDGLGHGPEAAEAASAFLATVRDNAEASLTEIFEAAAVTVAPTRGAVGLLARFDLLTASVSVLGVGNIDLKARSVESIHPVSTPGIIGRPVRRLRQFDYKVTGGDLIVITSDGISSRFELTQLGRAKPREIAETILEEFGRDDDDATCLVLLVKDDGGA